MVGGSRRIDCVAIHYWFKGGGEGKHRREMTRPNSHSSPQRVKVTGCV